MNTIFKIVLITFFYISFSNELYSQNSNFDTKKSAWATISSGSNLDSDIRFLGGGVMLSYSSNKLVFSGRYLNYIRKKQYDPFEADGFETTVSTSNLENYSEFSALFGYILNKRYFKFLASSGLGYFNWTREDNKKKPSIVVPIDVGIMVSPLPVLGIGIHMVSSVNQIQSVNGFLIKMVYNQGIMCTSVNIGEYCCEIY